MDEPRPEAPLSFEEARERLRARGYLDRGVEGAVLKGALAARSRALAVVRAASAAAAVLALAFGLVETIGLSAASGLSLPEAAVLFLWLLLPGLVVAAVVVALLALGAWLRTRGRTEASGVATEVALAAGLLAGGAGALMLRPLLAAGRLPALLGLLASVLAVVLAVRVARGMALTVLVASGRSVLSRLPSPRAALVAGLVVVGGGAGVWLAVRVPSERRPEPLVVVPSAARVAVVAVDGFSEPLLPAAGEAPLPPCGQRLAYEKETLDPAAFWTTVATGETVPRHGVGALDLVRLRGVSSPVRTEGAAGWYLRSVLPALGVARVESVTSAARRVPSLWEVAARAGVPALAVNWWTTYPASRPGATVLSNHLFFAARAGRTLDGEGWPAEAVQRAALLARPAAGSAPLPAEGTAARLALDARGLDAFAWGAFRAEWERGRPRLGLVYLPGLDILGAALEAPGRPAAERLVLARALVEEVRWVRHLLEAELPELGADLALVFLDGGRSSRRGLAEVSGPLAGEARAATVRPVDVTPTLLFACGVPASREVVGRPAPGLLRVGLADPGSVASWGLREAERFAPSDPREYVDNLRSLGYLR